MKTGEERAKLDEWIRPILREAIEAGFELNEIVFLLTRMLPELCTRDFAIGQVMAAFDLHEQRSKN